MLKESHAGSQRIQLSGGLLIVVVRSANGTWPSTISEPTLFTSTIDVTFAKKYDNEGDIVGVSDGEIVGVAVADENGGTKYPPNLRTRLLTESATYTLLVTSTATPNGRANIAFIPAPPSPLKPMLPLPAIVVMMPVLAVHFRTRWLYSSATYTFPAKSTATPRG